MILAFALLLGIPRAIPSSDFDQSHALWTEVLSAHVRGDDFDYRKLKEDPSKLEAYLGSLESVMPEEFASWKREQRFAFWIDAYNAYTVKRVVDAYPIERITSLDNQAKSVWMQETIPLGRLFPEAAGRELSLDEIEQKILRRQFKDARVHVAMNRATRSSPPLPARGFIADRLDDQLDTQVARWLATPARNRFDKKTGTIVVSKIFEWFKDDFVRDGGSVQAWIAARAPEREREWISSAKELKIDTLDYDWELNDAK